jgi:DNA invertase Pin-like site-specific DNA recombinase
VSRGLLDRRADPDLPRDRLEPLAGVATWEREIMLERQREGIAKAKSEGKFKGRKPKPDLMPDVIKARLAAGEKHGAIAKALGVARSSVYRAAAA